MTKAHMAYGQAEEVKKCILHGFQDLKALFLQSPF
jgi:hypothetical protein